MAASAPRTFPSSGTRTTASASPFFTVLPSVSLTWTSLPATGDDTRALRSGSATSSPGNATVTESTSRLESAVAIFAAAMTLLVKWTRFGSSSCSGSSECEEAADGEGSAFLAADSALPALEQPIASASNEMEQSIGATTEILTSHLVPAESPRLGPAPPMRRRVLGAPRAARARGR